jgi:predicted transcriptional regulator YdeE
MFSLFKKKQTPPTEPEIVQLVEPVLVIGIKTKTTSKKAFRDIAGLNNRFAELKKTREIPNRKTPRAFVAISTNYDEGDFTFDYAVGEIVDSVDEIPEEYVSFEIPAIKYAVFRIHPGNRFTWGLTILKIKKYAFTQWLPQSGYMPARTIDDFELHDERSRQKKDAEIDLFVAIMDKPQP